MIKKQVANLERDFYEIQLSHRDILNMVNDPNVMAGQVEPHTVFHIYLISNLSGKQIKLGDIETHEDLSIGFNQLTLDVQEEEFSRIDIIKNREPVTYNYDSIVNVIAGGSALERHNEAIKVGGGVIIGGSSKVSVLTSIETQGGAVVSPNANMYRIVHVDYVGGGVLVNGSAVMGWMIEIDVPANTKFEIYTARFVGTIDWGNGRVRNVNNTDGYRANTYADAGRYTISIDMEEGLYNFSYGVTTQGGSIWLNPRTTTANQYITKLYTIPNHFQVKQFQAQRMNHPDVQLESVFADSGEWLTGGYSNNTDLSRADPVVDFSFSSFTSLPEGLFANCSNIRSFRGTFGECKNLVNVPENLFADCISAENFYWTFSGCESLINAPSFSNLTSATDFTSTFSGCSSLTTIPDGMFAGCTSATDFTSTFNRCSSLTTIPDGLFDDCTSATNFTSTFENCSSLTTIPDGLFDDCTSATNFSSTFGNCSSLTTIPDGLFANNSDVISFGRQRMSLSNQFADYNQDGVLEEVRSVSIDYGGTGGGTFTGCTGLTNIPANLFGSKPLMLECGAIFSGCTGLTSIPQTLLDGFRNCKRFKNTFRDCSGITQVPAQLFHNCRKAGEFVRVFYGTSITSSDVPSDFFRYNKPNPYTAPAEGDVGDHWGNYGISDTSGLLVNNLIFIEVFGTQNHNFLYNGGLTYQAREGGCRDVVVIANSGADSSSSRSTLISNYGWKIASDADTWLDRYGWDLDTWLDRYG